MNDSLLSVIIGAVAIILIILASLAVNVIFFRGAAISPAEWYTAEEFCTGNNGIEYVEKVTVKCNNGAQVSLLYLMK